MNWINTVGDKQRDLLAGFWQSVEKAASMSDLSMRAVTDVEAAHVAVKIFGNLNSGSEGMVQYPPFVSEGHRDQLYLDVALGKLCADLFMHQGAEDPIGAAAVTPVQLIDIGQATTRIAGVIRDQMSRGSNV